MSRLCQVYEEALRQGRPFDTHMTTIAKEVQWWALKPALSKQRRSWSDIEGNAVDYKC